MTKKEQAAFDALREELRLARAMRVTEPVDFDVRPPELFSEGLSKGWLPIGGGEWGRVEPACSSSVSHGIGQADKTTSQRPIWLYSTKLLALRALRYRTERECMSKLAKIDEAIEIEMAGTEGA